MKFAIFLFEYKRDITEKNFGSKIQPFADRDHTTVKHVLDTFEDCDPTKNKEYVQWLVQKYLKNEFRIEDAPRIKEVLDRFVKIKNKLQQKDINRYSFHSLEAEMDKHFEHDAKIDIDAASVKGAKILYNGPLGQLSSPTTKKAACELGSGTKWCTAANNNNMFTYYNSNGPLYIWKDKNGEKFQFHFETCQFMNDKDASISEEQFKNFYEKNPVTRKLFKHYETELFSKKKKNASRYLEKLVQYNCLTDEVLDEAIKHLDPYQLYELALTLKKPLPESESKIASDAEAAYNYAIKVLKKPWPEGEKTILKDRHYGVLYRQTFPIGSFKSFLRKTQ